MDNLVIGLIVVLALAYIGIKIYKQVSGKGGCGCGGGDSDSSSKKQAVKVAVAVATVDLTPVNHLAVVETAVVTVPIKHQALNVLISNQNNTQVFGREEEFL